MQLTHVPIVVRDQDQALAFYSAATCAWKPSDWPAYS